MKIATSSLILLLLSGCSAFEPAFKPTTYRTGVDLTVIKRDNLPPPYDAPHLKKWGTFYCYTDKKCTIWIPTGDSACAKEVEAHERLHVKYGLWHDETFRLMECG